jgi:phosphoribosylformimino-5-aminoimidazole carboxamide ribotide isomerase
MLEVIPAVDIKEGRCVRLLQGDMTTETVYFEDPLDAAHYWSDQGAERLHIVDLDGAVSGHPWNRKVIEKIIGEIPIPIQLGGGIRTREDIHRYFDTGVDRIIVGTAVFLQSKIIMDSIQHYPKRIFLGIDAKDGLVAIEGWTEVTQIRPLDLIKPYISLPVGGVIYTDIRRDGMLTGPNLPGIREVVTLSPLPVIASGGISKKEDLILLAPFERDGLLGIIIGKALYSGALTLGEAKEAVRMNYPGNQS